MTGAKRDPATISLPATRLDTGSRRPSTGSRRENQAIPRATTAAWADADPEAPVHLSSGPRPASEYANQMLLEEAYRTVTIREGEKVVQLPVIKAVFRSLGVSAMKGNRLAQATMAELVRRLEEEDRQQRSSLFETACEYKVSWEQAIEHARRHGLPEPVPVPHPDDVILDMHRAEVRYEGPITAQEKKRWDRMLELRDDQQKEVSFFANKYRDAKNKKAHPDLLNSLATNWKRSVELYDRINEPLPDRYHKRLEDRFYPGILNRSGEEDEK